MTIPYTTISAIHRGDLPRYRHIQIRAERTLAGGGFEDMWGGTATTREVITDGGPIEIASDQAQDDEGGTGLLTAKLIGLNALGEREESDVITMDGAGAVGVMVDGVAASWATVNRFIPLTTGSSRKNVGRIAVSTGGGHPSPNKELLVVDAGQLTSNHGLFRLALGEVAILDDLRWFGPMDDWRVVIRNTAGDNVVLGFPSDGLFSAHLQPLAAGDTLVLQAKGTGLCRVATSLVVGI